MEQFSPEPQPRPDRSWTRIVRPNLRLLSNQSDESRLFHLRKHSMAICLAEALVITFLVYLLMRSPVETHPPSNSFPHRDNSLGQNQSCRTYHSNQDAGIEFTFLAGLVPGCNQRRRDRTRGVQCKSSQIDRCRSPYQPQANPSPGGRYIQVIETSKAGLRMEHSWRQVQNVDCGTKGSPETLNTSPCRFRTRVESFRFSDRSQKIIGWGGALTDSSISNILSLSINGTRRLLDDYFGEDGLLFNMIRVTIGGSDFSARFYTNHDEEEVSLPGRGKFNLMEEDYLYKIPMLRMVLDQYNFSGRAIKLFASMWSPPVWMKTNHHFNKGQLKGSINDEPLTSLSPPPSEVYFSMLADLKLEWLSSYKEHNIDFWGLTVMNEPIFAIQPFLNFNTMIFPREDYANYVAKYLGPKLKRNDKFKHIKLMVHDDNRRYLLNFTEPILKQRRMHQFVDGVSVHGYVDHEYDMMDAIYEAHLPSKDHSARKPDDWFVLPTELCSGHLPFMEKALIGNWQRGVHYALDIIHSLQHSAAGWVDWNMVLDLEGGPGWLGGRLDAPIIVDKATDSYHKSPMFYVLGQFSRFIPPNSLRFDTRVLNDSFDNLFEVVAFLAPQERPGGATKIVVVVVNDNPYEVKLLMPSGVNTRNNYIQLTVSPNSVTTAIYDAEKTK